MIVAFCCPLRSDDEPPPHESEHAKAASITISDVNVGFVFLLIGYPASTSSNRRRHLGRSERIGRYVLCFLCSIWWCHLGSKKRGHIDFSIRRRILIPSADAKACSTIH